MKKTAILIVLAMLVSAFAYAQEPHKHVIKKKELEIPHPEFSEMVIVGKDTVPLVMKERNYGRYDRGLFNFLYMPKGTWTFGLTASYGELGTENVQILSMLKNVDFGGKMYSVKPAVSFLFKNNQALGMQLNVTRGDGDLKSLSLDIDDDMSFTLRDVSYHTKNYSLAVFYRNYVGLSRDKRFAVFNEISLGMGTGSSEFKRYYNDELYYTNTSITNFNLNFSPGICVFMQENVAFNVSFGVFGLNMKKESQQTNGVPEGTRFSSGANFKFNIFNINFGLMVVI